MAKLQKRKKKDYRGHTQPEKARRAETHEF